MPDSFEYSFTEIELSSIYTGYSSKWDELRRSLHLHLEQTGNRERIAVGLPPEVTRKSIAYGCTQAIRRYIEDVVGDRNAVSLSVEKLFDGHPLRKKYPTSRYIIIAQRTDKWVKRSVEPMRASKIRQAKKDLDQTG
jgi:hypothetical protein